MEKIYATIHNEGEKVETPLGIGILHHVDAGGAFYVYFEDTQEYEQLGYGEVWILE